MYFLAFYSKYHSVSIANKWRELTQTFRCAVGHRYSDCCIRYIVLISICFLL